MPQEVHGAADEFAVAAVAPRIENADLDVCVPGESEKLLVPWHRLALVNQHAHAHAAVRSSQERVGDQNTRFVATKNVVLKIQGSLGCVDHFQAQQESVDADIENAQSRTSGILLGGSGKLLAEPGRLRLGQGH